MSDLEENYEFGCPYCMAPNSMTFDTTAGRRQTFVTDCETCCQPIEIGLEIDEDGHVEVTARQENE